jgi:SRSO17 transposase
VGGITPAELAAVRERLEAFADDVLESLPRKDQRARGECYLRGLMLDGRRKSIEPMAQRLGEVHSQALHHFVAVSPWDWRPVRRRLAEELVGALQPVAWAVDDTGFPKDGECWVGVQRQDCGTLGKTANCQLGCRSTPSPSRPAVGWTGDCLCPSPGTRPPWPSGARPATCPTACTTGPSGSWCWTCSTSFTSGVLLRRCWSPMPATATSASSARGWTTARSPTSFRSRATPAPTPSRCARPPRRIRAGASPSTAIPPAAQFPQAPGYRGRAQACVELIWRRASKGLQRSRFLALRVRPAGITPRRQAAARAGGVGWELPVRWLLAEWPAGQPEPVTYWLANLPDDTPIVELVRLGKLRWRIEHDDRELKGGLGLDHFEGRSFGGWHHHLTLVAVAHGFLTLERLRRPKPAASA